MTNNKRKFIAGLQITLDGFIEGREGEQDWADRWSTALGLIEDVDLFILGAGMFPDYGEYWKSIHEHHDAIPPGDIRPPNAADIAYADRAKATRHVVLSTTLHEVTWPKAEIVNSVDALRAIKAEPGGNAYVVGGATIVATLLKAGLIDELVLVVHPLLLGDGKALFEGVHERQGLELLDAKPTDTGRVVLRYRVLPTD